MVPPLRRGDGAAKVAARIAGGRAQHVAPLRLNLYLPQSAEGEGWTAAEAAVTRWESQRKRARDDGYA